MYYRYDNEEVYFSGKKEAYVLEKKAELEANTYFNSFSWNKWNKYTKIDHVYLEIEIEGKADIYLYQMQYFNGTVVEKVVSVQRVECQNRTKVKIGFNQDAFLDGVLAFKIVSLSDDTFFYGGAYVTDIDENLCSEVCMAINICTFKREKYVYRNMKILEREIWEKQDALKDNIKIFITDNGSSLDENRLNKRWIHLVKQGDNGSAGGFTRGLMEVIRENEKQAYSHVIMMDDDVLIEPEAIRKTYAFLKLLKEEYKDAFLGGALLRTDMQNIQYISGGTWSTKYCYEMHKIGYDLTKCSDVIKNEIEDNPTVNGWWYCCIPMSVVRKDNLPWPSYFHMDDMEYDIRNCRKLILLNGICVWHEPFENKPSSYTKYYDTRNVIITHLVHFPEWGKKDLKKFVKQSVFAQLQNYRYKDCWIVIRALNDLMRGPKWLMEINPIELLDEIIDMGYKKEMPENFNLHFDWDKYCESQNYSESVIKHCIRKLTLNGHFGVLTKHDYAVVQMFGPHPGAIFRHKKVLNYDEITERAFVTEKKLSEALKVCWSYFIIQLKLYARFKKLREQYTDKFKYMQTEEFWKKYLR